MKALRSDGALLSVGTLASGILAYAFNLLAARALGVDDYGPVALLWAAMFLVSVVLFRPVEQTMSRSIAERLALGQDARPVVRSATRLTLGLCAAVTLVTALAWGPLTDGLFAGHAVLTVALWAGIVGYGLSYWVRGLASGLQELGAYGVLLFVDGAARVILAVPLLIVASPAIGGVAIVGAAIGGPIAAGVMLRRGRLAGTGALGTQLAGQQAPFALGQALAFAMPVAVIAGAEQVLVSGGALLIAVTGGKAAAAAAGTVFAATMLVRAPVFLFQGVAAALLPRFTRQHATGDQAALRRQVLQVAVGMLTLSAVLVLGALALGPWLMTMLFGAGFDVSRVDLALLCAGVGTYLAAATLAQAALARGLAARAAGSWVLAAAAFVGFELALPGSPFHRVALAFTAGTTVAFLLLAAVSRVSFAPGAERAGPRPAGAAA